MKVAVVGATGFIGSKIVAEAIQRGHSVTAIARHIEKLPGSGLFHSASVDVTNTPVLADLFRGKDAVIHSYTPPKADSVGDQLAKQWDGTWSILSAMKAAGVRRILAVGGAGSLKNEAGGFVMAEPDFPETWKGSAKATALIKFLLREEPGLTWTYLSPSALITPGERTGQFRLGTDNLLKDASGKSWISVEDYAVAMIDELERPEHTGKRFTVGY